jgi:leader peptidase (prepilin peptidase)/N-methyltransferase
LTLAEAFAAHPWLLWGCALVVGSLVGSFLNVVIHRLPIMLERQWQQQARETLQGNNDGALAIDAGAADAAAAADAGSPSIIPAPGRYNLIVPASRCPKCNAAIKPYQNIPVISYVLLGGRCASCKANISPRYPAVELATAILSVAVVWRFGWHWQSAAALLFTWSLTALTVIDLDHQILPDIITLPLLWVGLLLSLAWSARLAEPIPVDPRSAIIGAVAGYTSLWLVFWAFKLLTGKEGMGYGDFKLFGAFGAWMGWMMLPLILLIAALAGALIGVALILIRGRDRNIPMPFGPYLATAAWIALMWGPQIVGGYLEFSGMSR